jgi:PAS domain S-box-containing protein
MRNRLVFAWKRALAMLAFVAASTLLARGLEPYVEDQACLLPFTLAVIASAWQGGLSSGIAATVVSFLIADYLFIVPKFQIGPFTPFHGVLFFLFLAVGVSISILKTALDRRTAALTATIEKLDRVTHRYELAAQHGRIGFQDYDASNGRQIWTPEMERLFGLAPGQFEGGYGDWIERVHPDDRERVAQQRSAFIEQRQSDWQYEYRALLPDGNIRWLEGRSRLFFSPSGSLVRILGATIDITKRRELEESLRERSNQLAAANKELERFAYIVSHDLQEPLHGITTMAELFVRRTTGILPVESLVPLDFVVKNCYRMRNLIRDILDLARAETDASWSDNVSVARVLETAIEELKRPIDDSHASITVGPMPTLQANQGQLVRLFRNLLSNAIKYRGTNAPNIHVAAKLEGRDWVFCVSDNGIGIDPRYHEQIFDAFARLHGQEEYEGTGLGLAICRKIVEHHHGRLWLESEPGKGSRFYFALPNAGAAPQPVPQSTAAASQYASGATGGTATP